MDNIKKMNFYKYDSATTNHSSLPINVHNKFLKNKLANNILLSFFIFSVSLGVQAQSTETDAISAGASSGIATNISTSITQLATMDKKSLDAAGCNQIVWDRMINDYAVEAQRHVAVANQAQVQNQVMATPEVTASCYDQAVQVINTAGRAYNTIASFLTGGGVDSGMLKDYATKLVVNEACNQVNNYIYQTGIGSMVSQGTGMVDGMLNQNIGQFGNTNINTGDILGNSGFKPNTDNNLPTLSSNDAASAVSGAVGGILNNPNTGSGGFWNSINPFK